MSEFNPNHTQYCRCLSCRTQRHSHQAFPESTLNAGLFAVGTTSTKLADLTDTRGVKLVDSVPASAITVTLRNVSISDDALVTAPDSVEYPFRLEPQASVELAVADISTHSISADEGVPLAVSYTRLMSERSASLNPLQLGVITVGASPVALTTIAAGNPALLKKLTIFNTGSGVVYLGSSTMNLTTMAGVVIVIPAGQSFTIGSDHMIDKVDWQKYSIHGSHATDLAVVTGEAVS